MPDSKNTDLDSYSADILVHATKGEPANPVVYIITDSVSQAVLGCAVQVNGSDHRFHFVQTDSCEHEN